MADIGEAIAEVEIVEWLVSEGDEVMEFDEICVVESDKATTPITSRYSGTITKLYYEEGDQAKTGLPLIDIDTEDDVPESELAAEPEPEAEPVAEAQESSGSAGSAGDQSGAKMLMTPAVRRIVKEHGIDLTQVTATGKNNRVLKEDVLNFIENGPQAAAAAPVSTPAPASPDSSSTSAVGATAPPVAAAVPVGEDKVVPIKGLQRTMVKTMNAAHAVPTFGYSDECVVDGLVAVRAELKKLAEARGIRLSYMPFMMKAASLALREFPGLNAYVNEDCTEVTMKASHNISLAMQTPAGLLVPNVKDVQNKTVFEIAAELNRLQELGSRGALGGADLTGGTFTLSNIGVVGGTYMSPILVVPQVAIGALGGLRKMPRFDADDNVIPTWVMEVSWSADHRVIDGVTMAEFSNLWKSYLANPSAMLLDMK